LGGGKIVGQTVAEAKGKVKQKGGDAGILILRGGRKKEKIQCRQQPSWWATAKGETPKEGCRDSSF